MTDRDAPSKISGSKLKLPKTPKSSKSNINIEMDKKIESFGEKVDAFIDQLQETGENVFSQEKKIQESKSLKQEIINLKSEIENEISNQNDLLDKIDFMKKDRVELETKYSEIVQQLEEENLKLNCQKANSRLGWIPKLNLEQGLEWVSDWYKEYRLNNDMKKITEQQIDKFKKLL